jgi:hypothetical protein
MMKHTFLPLCSLLACASISGTQTFQATQQFSMPVVGAPAGEIGARTVAVVGAAGVESFAESVLDDVDELRAKDHIDSVDAAIRVVSIRLSTDTTFAGVTALRAQLITGTETIELCSRTLSAAEQKSSSVSCAADQVVQEASLQQSSTSTPPTQIGAELDVSGAMTATKLNSVVTFEVEVNVDASL